MEILGSNATPHADRMRELDKARTAARDAADRKIADLQKQIAATRASLEADVQRLEKNAADERRKIADGLAEAWLSTAMPVFRGWTEEPSRMAARKVAEALVELRARVDRDLGDTLNPHVLIAPLVQILIERNPGAVDRFIDLRADTPSSALEIASRALRVVEVLPDFADALADLEAALERLAAGAGKHPIPGNVRRWQTILENLVDWRIRSQALDELNGRLEREHLATLPPTMGHGRVV